MERQKPDTTTNEIALYLRTVYSLLRSSGEVRVRSFEEAHSFSNSSLHIGAREAAVDVGAFGYAAARLPECMPTAAEMSRIEVPWKPFSRNRRAHTRNNLSRLLPFWFFFSLLLIWEDLPERQFPCAEAAPRRSCRGCPCAGCAPRRPAARR